MPDANAIKPGDTIYRPSRSRGGTQIDSFTVDKIGRIYLTTLCGVRINKHTMRDEYGITWFRTAEEYADAVKLQKAWFIFRQSVADRYRVPPNMTLDRICRATKILAEG